jgi:hypothetical protein
MNGNKFATGQILRKPVEVVKGRILAGWAQKSPEPWATHMHACPLSFFGSNFMYIWAPLIIGHWVQEEKNKPWRDGKSAPLKFNHSQHTRKWQVRARMSDEVLRFETGNGQADNSNTIARRTSWFVLTQQRHKYVTVLMFIRTTRVGEAPIPDQDPIGNLWDVIISIELG